MLNVNYHWDKLEACVVGKCYPPDFFNFIKEASVRSALEKVAEETQEDLEKLAKLLTTFGVDVHRPSIADTVDTYTLGNKILPPPITPRDHFGMVGNVFYMPTCDNGSKWRQLKGDSWPTKPPSNQFEFDNLPIEIKQELSEIWQITQVGDLYDFDFSTYKTLETYIRQTNNIVYDQQINSAMVLRLGKDLYFGTWPWQTEQQVLEHAHRIFPEYNCHVINTQGHLDGCMSVVSPGLILSSNYINKSVYDQLFPDYEVVYVNKPNVADPAFFRLKKQNQGNWWIKGQESNQSLTNFIDSYLKSWTGLIEETIVGINLLHVDKHTVICVGEDQQIFNKLKEYGVTAHPIEFRHFHFWDSGVHCLTNDISRIS